MADSIFDREKSVYMAELAQKDERYADMVKEMNNVAIMLEKLRENERNLLSVAYKNAVGHLMESWRALSAIEQDEKSRSNEADVRRINGDKLKLESEIIELCGDILPIIEKHFIPENSTPVDSLFGYKMMMEDYYMYLDELKTGRDKEKYERLQPILALSYPAFLKQVKQRPQWSWKMAKEAIDEAKKELDKLNDKAKDEGTDILDKLLLLYTISLWKPQGKKKLQDEPAGVSKEGCFQGRRIEKKNRFEGYELYKKMEHVSGVSLVTITRKNYIVFEIVDPGVLKIPNHEVYFIYGAGEPDKKTENAERIIITDVSLVTMEKTNGILFEIVNPEVLKNRISEFFIIFGEAKLKDMQGSTAAQPEEEMEEFDSRDTE